MVLIDITKEKEERMKKNEKQMILALSAVIAVFAVIFGIAMIKNRDDTKTEDRLKAAVEEETLEDSDTAAESGETDTASSDTVAQEPSSDTKSEPAAENQKSDQSVMDASDGYMFPDSDTEYITSDLSKMSTAELQYAINEIYARHGLKFSKKENKERFEKKKWYRAAVDDQESISLNTYEKKNVDVLASELKKRGTR